MIQVSDELIVRFIKNTCTDEELMTIKNWLDESDENVVRLFELEQMSMLADCVRKDDESRTRMAEGIKRRIENSEELHRRSVRLSVVRWTAGIAAMLAVVFGLGFHFLHASDAKLVSVVATAKSLTVTLPDSSVVFLNRHSQLTYPEQFADGSRDVSLKGEGFFKVSRDIHRPFHVSGEQLDVEVLGTVFNFVSRADSVSSVSLLEGSVKVTAVSKDESVVLSPGQKAAYSASAGHLTVQATNAAVDGAWHNKIIPFDNASLAEIVKILNQLYGVDIAIAGNVDQSKTYSGVTVFYDDIDSTLAYLSYTLPIKYVKQKGRFVISLK